MDVWFFNVANPKRHKPTMTINIIYWFEGFKDSTSQKWYVSSLWSSPKRDSESGFFMIFLDDIHILKGDKIQLWAIQALSYPDFFHWKTLADRGGPKVGFLSKDLKNGSFPGPMWIYRRARRVQNPAIGLPNSLSLSSVPTFLAQTIGVQPHMFRLFNSWKQSLRNIR